MRRVEGYRYSIMKEIFPIIKQVPFNNPLTLDLLNSEVLCANYILELTNSVNSITQVYQYKLSQKFETFIPNQGLQLKHHIFACGLVDSCEIVLDTIVYEKLRNVYDLAVKLQNIQKEI